jgi:hypothetical protein
LLSKSGVDVPGYVLATFPVAIVVLVVVSLTRGRRKAGALATATQALRS